MKLRKNVFPNTLYCYSTMSTKHSKQLAANVETISYSQDMSTIHTSHVYKCINWRQQQNKCKR